MLVDMGEPRALSTKPDGTAWRIGIANPADPSRSVATLESWTSAWPPLEVTAPCSTLRVPLLT